MRTPTEIIVNAPFAVPVSNGKNYWTDPPLTQIWALLYAQVTQVDGSEKRNLLLTRARASLTDLQFRGRSGSTVYGFAIWDQNEIAARLEQLGLPQDSGLSVVAVELLPEASQVFKDPLGADLGEVRVLRTSALTPVPTVCVDA
jgi:Fe2+ transport system protein FeoA